MKKLLTAIVEDEDTLANRLKSLLSAHDARFAITIFIEGDALHYLLKPVKPEKLYEVTDRAVSIILDQQRMATPSLCLKSGTRHLTFAFPDIIYIESRGRKVEIHTKQGICDVYAAIGKLEDELRSDFFRCHRCYLIHLGAIRAYDASTVTMADGAILPIASERHKPFVQRYLHYLKNG